MRQADSHPETRRSRRGWGAITGPWERPSGVGPRPLLYAYAMFRWGTTHGWWGPVLAVLWVQAPQPTIAQPARPVVAVFGLKTDGAQLKRSAVERMSKYLANGLVSSGRFLAVPERS